MTSVSRAARSARLPFVNALFFPVATLHAAVMLPLWVGGLLGAWQLPAGLDFRAAHAHEMLLGFGMAVVAGYLLGPQPMAVTVTLLGLWVTARIGFMTAPEHALALTSTALFAAGVAWRVVPRFALAAKQWRNRIVAPVVLALALLTFVGPGVLLHADSGPQQASLLLQTTVLLLGLLMFYMGGRILAAAIAGHLQRRGRKLLARVQPRLEGAALLALIGSLLLQPVEQPLASTIQGCLLCIAGLLTWVRLIRWQLWHCLDRPDLVALASGYAWLGIGLLMLGLARLGAPVMPSVGVHSLTMGALGTLTLTVMARTRLLYRFRDADVMKRTYFSALLISLATLARIAVDLPFLNARFDVALAAAAVLWSLACLGILPALFASTVVARHGRYGLRID